MLIAWALDNTDELVLPGVLRISCRLMCYKVPRHQLEEQIQTLWWPTGQVYLREELGMVLLDKISAF